ncbi:MAG: DUF3618 domain-containing protein [Candidatus Promineifilaceae bacterium]|nr:DUF3618 domain-containing protein [Candidatus Promineifilaceae bacterium]
MANTSDQSISRSRQADPDKAVLSDDPQVIRAQIARTRAQMGRTLNEIQDRLSPENIRQQTQESIKEATVEKVEQMAQTAERKVNNWRSNAVQTVKDNPVPMAMIGLGLGWLLLSDNSSREEESYRYSYGANDPYSYPYAPDRRPDYYEFEDDSGTLTEAQQRAAAVAENAQEWVGEKKEAAQQTVQDAASTVQDQASSTAEAVRENVGEAASRAQQAAGETAEQARIRMERARIQAEQQAIEVRRQARKQARRAKRSFWQTMEENPFAVGIAAAAAGAMVGLALPATEKENELMGETRDRLVQEATATAEHTMRKVQTAAQEVGQTAVEEAKRQADEQNLPTASLSEETKNQKKTAVS